MNLSWAWEWLHRVPIVVVRHGLLVRCHLLLVVLLLLNRTLLRSSDLFEAGRTILDDVAGLPAGMADATI